MARHIKSGEQVMVISGSDKGKIGRVLRVLTGRDRVSSKESTGSGSMSVRISATRKAAAFRRTTRST